MSCLQAINYARKVVNFEKKTGWIPSRREVHLFFNMNVFGNFKIIIEKNSFTPKLRVFLQTFHPEIKNNNTIDNSHFPENISLLGL